MPWLLLFLLVMVVQQSWATDYYVTPSGGSGSASTCPTTAPCTATRGLALAVGGDSVIFKNGTYSFQLITVRNGTSTAPIRFRAENRRQATLQFPSSPVGGKPRLVSIEHDWIIVSGFVIKGKAIASDTVRIGGTHDGTVVSWAEHNIFEDNLIDAAGGGGTNIHDARFITYRYNEMNTTGTTPPSISSPSGSGFYMGSAGKYIVNGQYTGSRVDQVDVYNNVIRNVRQHNLADYKQGTLNIRFHDNIFDGHVRGFDDGRADGYIASVAQDGVTDSNHTFTDSILRNMQGSFYVIRVEREVDVLNNVFWNMTDSGTQFIEPKTHVLSNINGNITCAPMPTVEAVNRGTNSHNRPQSECNERARAIVGVPKITSCEIGAVDDSTLVVNLDAGRHPPISTVGILGELAVTYGGVGQTENSVALTSGSQARIVMASPPADSGVTVRISVAAGIIKNSAFMGGKNCGATWDNLIKGQGVCGVNDATTGSGVICQNTTGSTPEPNEELDQAVYRFYNSNEAEGVGEIGPENTGITSSLGDTFRWRVGVRGGGNDAASRTYQLASRICNPTCQTWLEVTGDYSSTGITFQDDELQSHGAATTNHLSLGDKDFVAGVFMEMPGDTPAVAIASTQQVEWEYSLTIPRDNNPLSAGQRIELRMQHGDGTALANYTAVPSITIGAANSGITGSFAGGVIQ